MKLQVSTWVVLLLAFSFVTGCSKLFHNSPAEVVTSIYGVCNAGKYSEAEAYLSSNAKALITGPLGAAGGGVQGFCNYATRNGTLRRVEILKVEIRGEGARVFYRLRFKDGSAKDDHDDLIKENGRWKENH